MKLEISSSPSTGDKQYILTLSQSELASFTLNEMDQALIDECFNAPDSTIADKLLGLQTIAFRIEQQNISQHPT